VKKHGIFWASVVTSVLGVITVTGCSGYSNSWLYPTEVQTVYVEMFDTNSFRRGHEVILTDAICKRLEAQTPYKIVSDRNVADSVLSGELRISSAVLTTERYSGRALENESIVDVTVSWKNLKTGKLLIDRQTVQAGQSSSPYMGQTFEYAVNRATNEAAVKIVELMETPW
jgi:hypothetical protein